jgi:Rrf2 family transcriptional regulator, iron-sulfur cluster assembly transcription factor
VPRLTKKLLFAIEAVLDIAYNAGPAPVQSSEIGERQGIPRRYLEHVLQLLVREGILQGVRGPRGGYRLGRERRRISVGEIVRIISQAEASEDPTEDPAGTELGRKVVRPLWREVESQVMSRLDGVTLEELCIRAHRAGIPGEFGATLDYTI